MLQIIVTFLLIKIENNWRLVVPVRKVYSDLYNFVAIRNNRGERKTLWGFINMSAGVHARAGRMCHSEMSKYKSQIIDMTGDANDVMHRKRARRILGIWEKSVSWVLASKEEGWLSELAEALLRVLHVLVGGRWKSLHRKIVYLSPYLEKPLNSKVIKSFVPELGSRKCFLCFGIPMLSIYELWTFYVHFTYSCMAM